MYASLSTVPVDCKFLRINASAADGSTKLCEIPSAVVTLRTEGKSKPNLSPGQGHEWRTRLTSLNAGRFLATVTV